MKVLGTSTAFTTAVKQAANGGTAANPEATAALPTYATIASVMEKQTGSGWRLAGWTVARSVLIFPPMMLVGVEWKKAIFGALLSSGIISVLALARIHNAGYTAELKLWEEKKWELRGARRTAQLRRGR